MFFKERERTIYSSWTGFLPLKGMQRAPDPPTVSSLASAKLAKQARKLKETIVQHLSSFLPLRRPQHSRWAVGTRMSPGPLESGAVATEGRGWSALQVSVTRLT